MPKRTEINAHMTVTGVKEVLTCTCALHSCIPNLDQNDVVIYLMNLSVNNSTSFGFFDITSESDFWTGNVLFRVFPL